MAEMDVEKRDNDTRVSPKDICQCFIPQQWRKTKCKLCFHDIMDHTKNLTKQQSEELIRTSMNLEESLTDISTTIMNEETSASDSITSTKAETPDIIEPCYSPRSTYTTGSSKGSSDRLDDETEDTASSKFGGYGDSNMKDSENEDEESSRRRSNIKGKIFPSPFGYEQQDSIDIEEGGNSPRTIKRRNRSYHKRDSNLLQFSAMMRSSNSSLCSFTSEYTDGYSDYDYDIRSITDDTDDYTEVNDVIDELENIKPELKARVQNERRISRSKILDLERELEGQLDHYRATEVAKERQILAYQREIEGLKLELSSVKAHEHILALKSRLELEGKTTLINDLQQQVQSLQNQLTTKQEPYDVAETQQDVLNRNLDHANKRIIRLEEENIQYQEKIRLAEDLQNNDRELLEFLRKQLTSLENDLVSARQNNRYLEDNLKLMEVTRNDYVKEEEKNTKLTKELESIRQKVKRRDRHIDDLEDDNVKLQQLKTELESQLSKRDFKMKKMERRVSELQSEVTKCNKEIADLTGEKKTFEQVRKLTDLKLKDLQGASPDGSTEVENGKNIFIHTLEERLRHSESRAKELQLENNTLLKDLREICDNLNNTEKENEEYKDTIKEWEQKCRKMKDECKHKEKKNEWLQRRLHKSEQEKKRAINRQNDAEIKLTQHQEQYLLNTDINLINTENIDENDTRMLKLKLQSTEAKLQMIEGNKGYLEKKVNSLERKVQDKELAINRLLDSMERDSGAPSQDYDRFDALEHENGLLKSQLEEITLENMEQKKFVAQLEENNTHLDATIKNLNEKLESCNVRLKELENANHKLGREAFRRSQCFTGFTGREDETFNELRNQNKILQEKVDKFNDLEEDIKQLNGKLKKEKGNVQWYSEENEKLKLKIIKLTQNVQSLESSKKEFEKSIQKLQNTNKELDNEVMRLEEKLEIYGDLFGKDSKLSSSLRRRSYQSDEERDEERMFKNALAPLMEEIKEKDNEIRLLNEAMEEKNLHIESLQSEIDRLDQNIAAQITEKIRNIHFSGDSSGENEHSEGEAFSENLISINQRDRTCSENNSGYSPTNSLPRKNSNVDQPGRISPELDMKNENTFVPDNKELYENDSNNKNFNNSSINSNNVAMTVDTTNDPGLTVTTGVFFDILRERQESLEQKDLEYRRNMGENTDSVDRKNIIYNTIEHRYSGTESPTENKFYSAIENALLDHYEDNRPSSSLPSLTNLPNNCMGNKDSNDPSSKKLFVEDMYEQLAELECMVNIKYKSPQVSPKQEPSPDNSNSPSDETNCVNNINESTDTVKHAVLDDSVNSETSDDKIVDKTKDVLCVSNISGKIEQKEFEEICRLDKDSEITLTEKGLDLSGLDDLLAEVNRRGNDYQEQVVLKKQKLQERRSLPSTCISTPTTPSKSTAASKIVMPSIRTTKRQIIRLKELNRSESFESSTGFFSKSTSSNSLNITRSSVSSDSGSLTGCGNSVSSTSSLGSSSSQVSVVYAPHGENESKISDTTSDNTVNSDLSTNGGPFRRPNIDVNKFLNSSFSNIDNSKS